MCEYVEPRCSSYSHYYKNTLRRHPIAGGTVQPPAICHFSRRFQIRNRRDLGFRRKPPGIRDISRRFLLNNRRQNFPGGYYQETAGKEKSLAAFIFSQPPGIRKISIQPARTGRNRSGGCALNSSGSCIYWLRNLWRFGDLEAI